MNLVKPSLVLLHVTLSLSVGGCGSVPAAPDPVVRTLAPTGTLGIAVYQGSPTSLVRRSANGEARGVAVDLGSAMAARLGVAHELMEFKNNADALLAVKEGRADFAFTNASPARARDMDFSPAVLAAEQGYLVPRDSPLRSADSVDAPGVRIGVARGSSSERELAGILKVARIVPVPSLKDATKLLGNGGLDAFATNKAILFEMSDSIPGSRVLAGNYGREGFAIGIPKGRESGLPWLRKFVEEAKSNGTVARAIERAGLRGVTMPD